MDVTSAQRSTIRVGLITLPIGIALVSAPARVGRLLSPRDHSVALRVIGVLDLALVPGLVTGRRPKQWMIARAGLNLGIASYCLLVARRDGVGPSLLGAVAMVAATVADRRTIAALRHADGDHGHRGRPTA